MIASKEQEIQRILRLYGRGRFIDDMIEPGPEGGFHKVFFAREKKFGLKSLDVAIKKVEIIPANLEVMRADGVDVDDYQVLERLREEELKILNLRPQIRHENILNIYEPKKDIDGNIYFIEDRFDYTLEELLNREGSLSVAQSIDLFGQIINGLARAHKHGLIHKDLKANNVGIFEYKKGDVAAIFDFGTSEFFQYSRSSKWGTPEAKAKEVLEGGEFSESSDVYSAGLILYQMVTGKDAYSTGLDKPPSSPISRREANAKILAQMKDPKKLAEIVTDVNERFSGHKFGRDFAEILMKCMEPDDKKRYKNAIEVKEDIAGVESRYDGRRFRRKMRYAGVLLAGVVIAYSAPPLIDHWSFYNCCVKGKGDESPVGRGRDMFRIMSQNEGNLWDRFLTPIQLRWLHHGIERCSPTEDVLKIPEGKNGMVILPEEYWQTRIRFRPVERFKKPYYCDGEGEDYRLLYDYDHIVGVSLFLKKGLYRFKTKAAVHRWFFDNEEMDLKKGASDLDDPEVLDIRIAGQEFQRLVTAQDKSYGKGGKYYNFPAKPNENTVIEYPVLIPHDGCWFLTLRNGIKDNWIEGYAYGNKDMLIGSTEIKREE